jgi:hypothetical protein
MAIGTTTVSTGILESSLTTNTNYLQPTGFKLSINRKYFPNLEYFAQSVMHPDTQISALEIPYKRIGSIPFTGDKLVYGELTAMIIMDEDLSAYSEMYNWIKSFVEAPDIKPSEAKDGDKGPSEADITVSILTSHNNVAKKIIYRNAIPTLLGDIAFEASQGDVNYITFPISFRFTYFDIE